MNDYNLVKPPLIKMNSVHANGIIMACKWICKRFYTTKKFDENKFNNLNFKYLFGVEYDELANKYLNSHEFLKLFDYTEIDSIPKKCLAYFSENNEYAIAKNNTIVKNEIVDYEIVSNRFWKSLGRDILDCFLKREALKDATEWLDNMIIDSFGGVFKLTVWKDVFEKNRRFFKYNEWTHVESPRIILNDDYMWKNLSIKGSIEILLKIIGPLKIGIALYAMYGLDYLNKYGIDNIVNIDKIIISLSYEYFPIYYIRAGPSNMFTNKKITNTDFSIGPSAMPFGIELQYIDNFLNICPSAIIISVVNTSTMNPDNGHIVGFHWVMLSFEHIHNRKNMCTLICSMGNNFNCLSDEILVPYIKSLTFNIQWNEERIQRDGHSCGVYSILAMMYYSTNRDIRNTINKIKELKRSLFDKTNGHEDMIKIIENLVGVVSDNEKYKNVFNGLMEKYTQNRPQPYNIQNNISIFNPRYNSQSKQLYETQTMSRLNPRYNSQSKQLYETQNISQSNSQSKQPYETQTMSRLNPRYNSQSKQLYDTQNISQSNSQSKQLYETQTMSRLNPRYNSQSKQLYK